jgi:hypothetical protein
MPCRQTTAFFSQRTNGAALSAITLSLTMPVIGHPSKPSFSDARIASRLTAAGFPYQNGGFTYDEQQAMTRAAHDYNLRLSFTSSAGAFAVPEFVIIGANQGGKVEKIALTAPWFHIRLPPGSYTVLARFRSGIVLIRDIHLQKGQSRAMRVQAAN